MMESEEVNTLFVELQLFYLITQESTFWAQTKCIEKKQDTRRSLTVCLWHLHDLKLSYHTCSMHNSLNFL